MPYFCAECRVLWPCLVVQHNDRWSSKLWYPEGHDHSIACFVFDHDECRVPQHCRCVCHRERLDEPSAFSVPPTNR